MCFWTWDNAHQNIWDSPAAKQIPREGYLEQENGYYLLYVTISAKLISPLKKGTWLN